VNYHLRYTDEARKDLERLYRFLAQNDTAAARRALEMIDKGFRILEVFPFSCRKADPGNSFLRELIIPFGSTGYVALFEIESDSTVTILAVRHQREEDFH